MPTWLKQWLCNHYTVKSKAILHGGRDACVEVKTECLNCGKLVPSRSPLSHHGVCQLLDYAKTLPDGSRTID